LEKKEDRDKLFVEVNQPSEVRRNVLESLKEVIESLERFEKFKEARHVKIENINMLGEIMKEISKISSSLRQSLPEMKLGAIKSGAPNIVKKKMPLVAEKEKAEDKTKETEEKKPDAELQKLEAELNAIEAKLGSLG